MAFTSVERSICNKLGFDTTGILNSPKQAKGAATNKLSSIRSALAGYVASPQSAIDAATASLTSNALSIFPGSTADDVQKMLDLINSCAYLNDNEKLNNPISLAKALTDSLFDQLNDYVSDVTSLPEYLLGQLMSFLDELYGNNLPDSGALSDTLKNSDKIINCLSNLCNGEYTSDVVALTLETEGLYNSLAIVDDPLSANYGLLDKTTLYSDAGLLPAEVTKITGAVDEVNSLKSDAKNSIQSLMTAAKAAKKLGDLF